MAGWLRLLLDWRSQSDGNTDIESDTNTNTEKIQIQKSSAASNSRVWPVGCGFALMDDPSLMDPPSSCTFLSLSFAKTFSAKKYVFSVFLPTFLCISILHTALSSLYHLQTHIFSIFLSIFQNISSWTFLSLPFSKPFSLKNQYFQFL